MLAKKLKRFGKECRNDDDPVLQTLAAYVDHVVSYLERAKDDDVKAKEYGNVLARLDLSAAVRAREALAVTEQEAGTTPVERSGADEKKAAKKAKKREAKEKKKAEEAQAVAAPATPQEVDTPAQSPVESSSGEEKKTGKKNKKKGK